MTAPSSTRTARSTHEQTSNPDGLAGRRAAVDQPIEEAEAQAVEGHVTTPVVVVPVVSGEHPKGRPMVVPPEQIAAAVEAADKKAPKPASQPSRQCTHRYSEDRTCRATTRNSNGLCANHQGDAGTDDGPEPGGPRDAATPGDPTESR